MRSCGGRIAVGEASKLLPQPTTPRCSRSPISTCSPPTSTRARPAAELSAKSKPARAEHRQSSAEKSRKVGLRSLVSADAAEPTAALPAYGSAGTDYCEGDRHRVPSSARRNDRRFPSVPAEVEWNGLGGQYRKTRPPEVRMVWLGLVFVIAGIVPALTMDGDLGGVDATVVGVGLLPDFHRQDRRDGDRGDLHCLSDRPDPRRLPADRDRRRRHRSHVVALRIRPGVHAAVSSSARKPLTMRKNPRPTHPDGRQRINFMASQP